MGIITLINGMLGNRPPSIAYQQKQQRDIIEKAKKEEEIRRKEEEIRIKKAYEDEEKMQALREEALIMEQKVNRKRYENPNNINKTIISPTKSNLKVKNKTILGGYTEL